MEETQVDVKSKSRKETKENVQYSDLKSAGIPIKQAVFHKTVSSWTGEPEYSFYDATDVRGSRQAKMWYTPHGLIVEQQKNKKLIIPLANIVLAVPQS